MIDLSKDFLDSLYNIKGIDRDALLKALDTPPGVSVRFNRRKFPAVSHDFPMSAETSAQKPHSVAGADIEAPVAWCRDGYYLSQRPVFTLDPLLHAGVYYVQDASSMIYQQIIEKLAERLRSVTHSASFRHRDALKVLDFCAAPGGKTTAIINAIPDGSIVVANEFVAARGKILRENLEKWGYPGVITTGCASAQYRNLPPIFDIVAVDAPCSGEGMMRKDEDARAQWSDNLVSECAALQKEILSDLVSTLRPGGYLIYSTCTFNIRENEENSLYISQELGLTPVSPDDLGLEGIERPARTILPATEGLRFMPHLTHGEGLYVSIFRKPEGDISDRQSIEKDNAAYAVSDRIPAAGGRKKKDRRAAQQHPADLPADIRRAVAEWFIPDLDARPELSGNMITILPANVVHVAEALRRAGINITGAGLPVAELKTGTKKCELIPDSRVALNSALKKGIFPEMELSDEEALKYLRRDAITPGANIPKGFVVVTYKGAPLGMIKNLGNRANNLYPMPWRIRMQD